jgi:16S rRNA (guanine1207-N2)-methyltransferase
VESARWGAERNCLPNLSAHLDCDGSTLAAGSFDLVLANPPYYSNFRLAELFVEMAYRALSPGGKLLVVTKMPDWYLERLPPRFTDLTATAGKSYCVLQASKRSVG